jgi:hypothetical protein
VVSQSKIHAQKRDQRSPADAGEPFRSLGVGDFTKTAAHLDSSLMAHHINGLFLFHPWLTADCIFEDSRHGEANLSSPSLARALGEFAIEGLAAMRLASF